MKSFNWIILVLFSALIMFIFHSYSKQNTRVALMDRGFCFEEERYLSVLEIKDRAVLALVTRMSYEFQELDAVDQSNVLFTSPNFTKFPREDWNNIYQYKSVDEFTTDNPMCCQLVLLPPGGVGKAVSYLEEKPYILVDVKFKDLKENNYSGIQQPSAEIWITPCGRPAIIRFSNSVFKK